MKNEARFVHPTAVLLGDRIEIGKGTWVGPFVLLDGQVGSIKIGEWCDISAGVQVYTHSTDDRCVTGDLDKKWVGPVNIGDRVYVGPNAVITYGTCIGANSKVGALSLVKGKFPERSMIAGIPASLKRRL